MARAILFLFIILISAFTSAHAVTISEAMAQCQAYLAELAYQNNGKTCFRSPSSTTTSGAIWYGNYPYGSRTFTYSEGCPAPSTWSDTLGRCLANCNTTPTQTTIGTSSTLSWQTDNGDGTCQDHSITCNQPLIPNSEQKRCDLDCGNGVAIDPASGGQCPACLGQQVRNPQTNLCEDPTCPAGQYLDPAAHVCRAEPVCIGDQTLDTSSQPHACLDPTCTAPQVLNEATKKCEVPPKDCPAGYSRNQYGVCEFVGCTPPLVACMIGGSRSCVTSCPNPYDPQSPDGNGKGAGTNPGSGTGAGSDANPTPDPVPVPNPDAPSDPNNPNQVPPTPAPSDSGMGTFAPAVGEPDAELGKWYDSTDETYQQAISDSIGQIQATPIMQFGQNIFAVSVPSGSCPVWTIPAVMGMQAIQIDALCSDTMESIWPLIRAVVIGSAVFMAFRIALTGLT